MDTYTLFLAILSTSLLVCMMVSGSRVFTMYSSETNKKFDALAFVSFGFALSQGFLDYFVNSKVQASRSWFWIAVALTSVALLFTLAVYIKHKHKRIQNFNEDSMFKAICVSSLGTVIIAAVIMGVR